MFTQGTAAQGAQYTGRTVADDRIQRLTPAPQSGCEVFGQPGDTHAVVDRKRDGVQDLRQRQHFMPIAEAVRIAHYPPDEEAHAHARETIGTLPSS